MGERLAPPCGMRMHTLSPILFFVLTCGCGDDSGSGGSGGQAGSGPEPTAGSSGSSGASGQGGSGGSMATSSGGASGQGGTGAPGLVPVFVAQGHMGRLTISCDDGRSWILDRSLDDSVRCFDPLDCDHTEGAGRGLAFGDGQWIATFGWGKPGTLQRSNDGNIWEVVLDPSPTFADVAFGQGAFIGNTIPPQLSPDGKAWKVTPSPENLNVGNARAIGFSPDNGGVFVITGESGNGRDIVLSNDGGQTWWHPDSRPDECVEQVRGIAGGNGALVAASAKGFVCTSSDGGKNWSKVDVGDWLSSPPLFTGTEFMVWESGTLHRSSDGKSWSSEPGSPAGISIGPVARGPNGTFVAANDGWMVWYEKQAFYRSNDGVNWEVLDKAKFKGSHPINFIEPGFTLPNDNCKAP
jgi:hypothetical protein